MTWKQEIAVSGVSSAIEDGIGEDDPLGEGRR